MTFLLYLPIVLSLFVLGAHFLRYQSYIGVAVSLLLVGLLFVRRAWVARVVQVALVLGSVEWLWTLYTLAQARAAMGQPATRMIVILGVVAAITLSSAFLFQSTRLKKWYGLD